MTNTTTTCTTGTTHATGTTGMVQNQDTTNLTLYSLFRDITKGIEQSVKSINQAISDDDATWTVLRGTNWVKDLTESIGPIYDRVVAHHPRLSVNIEYDGLTPCLQFISLSVHSNSIDRFNHLIPIDDTERDEKEDQMAESIEKMLRRVYDALPSDPKLTYAQIGPMGDTLFNSLPGWIEACGEVQDEEKRMYLYHHPIHTSVTSVPLGPHQGNGGSLDLVIAGVRVVPAHSAPGRDSDTDISDRVNIDGERLEEGLRFINLEPISRAITIHPPIVRRTL